jgi:hypothetical protein
MLKYGQAKAKPERADQSDLLNQQIALDSFGAHDQSLLEGGDRRACL